MAKKLAITHVSGNSKNLSKEQKRFNTYTTKVKTLKIKVETLKNANQELYRLGEERIRPMINKEAEALYALVLALDRSKYVERLSANKRKKYRKIMCEMTEDLISNHNKEDLTPIYDKNAEKGEDYAEMQRQQEEMNKEMAKRMAEMMFGVKLDDEDLENPENFQAKMNEKLEEEMAREEEARSKRKKTAKQIAKEEREREAENKLAKSSKQIYLQLAKAFHPDKAENEEEEKRRTEILQEVNAAYEANDLMKLLEMQISLMEGKEEQLTNMSDNVLEPYNKVLKRQIDELEQQAYSLNPQLNGHPYANIYNPDKLRQENRINLAVKEYKAEITRIMRTIELIAEEKGFKNFIANFDLEEDEIGDNIIFDFL